ncbi:hypothetical protein STEG23_005597, partial [Scotinomys teguina]
MSPVLKDPDCFTPMICHCKVACTNNTLSLMFGCKGDELKRQLGGFIQLFLEITSCGCYEDYLKEYV